MTPLFASRIHARHPLPLACVWGFRLLGSFFVAQPICDVFRGLGVGSSPLEDAGLFEPGGILLVEALRLARTALGSSLLTAFIMLSVLGLLSLLPLSGLMVALSLPERLPRAAWFAEALRRLPRFVLLSGLTLLGQAAVLIGFILVHTPLRRLLGNYLNDRQADLGSFAWFTLTALALSALSIWQDLARAASVQSEANALTAIRHGFDTLRAHLLRALGAWLLATSAAAAIVAVAAFAVERLHLERPDGVRLFLVFVIHQIAAFTVVVCRAGWLAQSLHLVLAQPAPDQRLTD